MLDGFLGVLTIEGIGEVFEVLSGVVEVQDADGVWEVDASQFPDPSGTVAEENCF